VQGLGGSRARQIAKLVNGNIPYHGRHAQFMNGGWPGRGENCLFSWEFVFSFVGFRVFFWSFAKSAKYVSCEYAQILTANWWSGGDKIVYSVYGIFVIIISSSSIVISIFSFVLLNCIYLSLWVFPFVHFTSPSCWGEKGRGDRGAV